MNYTKYFGLITKDNGALNLTNEQFQRLMNIAHIEGVILGLNKAKNTYKGKELFFRYDTLIVKQNKILTELTGNLEPKELIKEMYSLSN